MFYGLVPKNWKDVLALLMLAGIPGIVVWSSAANVPIPDTAVGAFIVGWTLVVQYYWRKAETKP